MGNVWTKEQQQVIDLRDCDMLVSAAAGSGKTAVLVERIISRIMETERPADIDRLLVVTFTNAAAAEMRERILAALEEKLEECPENVHLQRQITLVHRAQITTIHSFCLNVIRNHFHTIALDPGFRIGDEGELKLLRHDVMERLLEEAYEKADPQFLQFAETFAPGKSDQGLEEVILQFYDFSMGHPWPAKWREACGRAYEEKDPEAFFHSRWMECLLNRIKIEAAELRQKTERALRITEEADGPWMYGDALKSDLERMRRLEACEGYEAYEQEFAKSGSFPALSRKKDPNVSEEKKELVKELRDQVKTYWKRMQEDYFFESSQQMMEDMQRSSGMVRMLILLTDQFQKDFEQQKSEKNLVDFNDLEHLALQILLKEENGSWEPSPVALEYAENFQEIMIDEYQDSNLVQEILLTSVSRKSLGEHNRFMVGDVKQSIYRFRLARPELFMNKYQRYTKEDGQERRIDLHKNFRSRKEVLDGVNLIFRQIMRREAGGVAYDDDAALYPGASYAPGGREAFYTPELLLILPEEEDQENAEESSEAREEYTLRQLEAQTAGLRIREMVGKETVWDKEEKRYRPVRYSDIVILLRTLSGWTETFVQTLGEMGIPSYAGTNTGYFSALEIKTILSYLRVLDNPRQDIPLASVLRSPIGKMTDEELALIRIRSPKKDFYTCCMQYLEYGSGDPEISATVFQKLARFWEMTDQLRRILPYTPMHQLLWKILEVTGYGEYAAALPGGAQRRANLEMLVEKAAAYEKTSYRGLFNFIRYMEHLQKYEIDYGEASVGGEAEDTVRIMSIHKSKGLEFPIVLICGMEKGFNQQDSRSSLVLHPELGVGCDCTDLTLRVKLPLLAKKIIGRQIQEETLGEELRVLYVAMTRAKEKLILIGAVKKLEEKLRAWCQDGAEQEEQLPYLSILSARNYLDWIMPALLRHRSGKELLNDYALPGASEEHPIFHAEGNYQIRRIAEQEERSRKQSQKQRLREEKERLLHLEPRQIYDAEMHKTLSEVFSGDYAHTAAQKIVGKMTVSQLKRMGAERETEDSKLLYPEEEIVPLLPKFKQEEEPESGAARGTVYHQFLEALDFSGEFDQKFVETQLETMVRCGKILEDEAKWISRKKILRFLQSEIGKRMQRADKLGNLYREQPFVLGIASDQIQEDWDSGEEVLIQGIIDAYFYEGDGIVLLDYKTDFIPKGKGGSFLVERYGLQLEYYQMALERLTGKKVKEKQIYSFYLEQSIRWE